MSEPPCRMTLATPALEATLRIIVSRLEGLDQPWAFTGSVGRALQGMDVAIGDIDIQTTRAGAYRVEERLSPFVTSTVRYLESERMRSHHGVFLIHVIRVEVMGDIEKRLDDESWLEPPDLPSVIRHVALDGVQVPVLDLAYEKEAYRIMGRMDTVRRIEDFLRQHRCRDASA